jgi:small GTP-binding protein
MTDETPSREEETSCAAALTSVRHAIAQFEGCSQRERQALCESLDQLEAMAKKLESGRVEVVVFGEISTGKSALINALTDRDVANVSVRGGWTREVWHVTWDGCGYCVPSLGDSQVVLVDTPGLNEVDGQSRARMAHDAAERADVVLFVTDSDLNDAEYSALTTLAMGHKPILLALNKADLYTEEQLDQLVETFTGPRLAGLVEPESVVVVAADPKEVEYVIEAADGRSRSEWRKPPADVERLRLRLLEVLHEGGEALIALNGAMFAADRSDRIAAVRVRMREERAAATVWSYAVTKAIAVALNPVPVADIVGGSAVDVAMVVTLAKVYGITLTTANARALINAIVKAAGWILLSEAATHFAAAIFKGLTLGQGTVLTALPQGAAAGYGSYIVGQASRYYFAHGASWGHEAPKTVVSQILELTDKESVLERLKDEIKKKIRLNPYAGKTES